MSTHLKEPLRKKKKVILNRENASIFSLSDASQALGEQIQLCQSVAVNPFVCLGGYTSLLLVSWLDMKSALTFKSTFKWARDLFRR